MTSTHEAEQQNEPGVSAYFRSRIEEVEDTFRRREHGQTLDQAQGRAIGSLQTIDDIARFSETVGTGLTDVRQALARIEQVVTDSQVRPDDIAALLPYLEYLDGFVYSYAAAYRDMNRAYGVAGDATKLIAKAIERTVDDLGHARSDTNKIVKDAATAEESKYGQLHQDVMTSDRADLDAIHGTAMTLVGYLGDPNAQRDLPRPWGLEEAVLEVRNALQLAVYNEGSVLGVRYAMEPLVRLLSFIEQSGVAAAEDYGYAKYQLDIVASSIGTLLRTSRLFNDEPR